MGHSDTVELDVKVIDFGLAKAIADAGGEMDLTHGEFVGTPNSRALSNLEAANRCALGTFIRSARRSGSRSPDWRHSWQHDRRDS